jgi:hypothetical protein
VAKVAQESTEEKQMDSHPGRSAAPAEALQFQGRKLYCGCETRCGQNGKKERGLGPESDVLGWRAANAQMNFRAAGSQGSESG